MGIIDGFKKMINPDSINDNDDEYIFDGEDDNNYENDYTQTQTQNIPQQNQQTGYAPQRGGQQQQYQQPMNQQSNQQNAQGVGGMTLNSTSLELKVVRPERFDAVKQISDHLLNRRTVVLNLEATNKENARRMIDFLSGVAYAIGGNIKKVSNNTYVITPNNVDISAEQQQQFIQDTTQQSPMYNNDL